MRRLLEYLLIVWIVLTINFLLPRLIPGDPILYLTGEATGDSAVVVDEQTRQRMRQDLGLDQPLAWQYVRYLGGLLGADLGRSIHHRVAVLDLIRGALPWTLALVLTAVCLATLLGAGLGTLAAWRRGSPLDRALTVPAVALMASPSFLLAMVLQLVCSIKLGLLPASGGETVHLTASAAGQALDLLRHALLPVAALTLALLPESFFCARNNLGGVLASDFVFMARLKGLPEWRVLYGHALRAAMLPLLTQASLRLGLAMGGTIFVESVFSYPGLGDLMYRAVTTHDYPLAQGIFLVITLAVLTINLLLEVAYRRLDPRVRAHDRRA